MVGCLQQHAIGPDKLPPNGNIEHQLCQRLKPLIDKARKSS